MLEDMKIVRWREWDGPGAFVDFPALTVMSITRSARHAPKKACDISMNRAPATQAGA
ncbi:hypothetical protein OOJ09_14815 [Mesorhizobium qingshengii]|uniref:Uncharacterized protein n=1 Tax=Mesorhizobium qingshengii TaxID=1165689 RepID=A0ABT4QV41_9HYPH|nr:hypothetical protein [Mesorhizobium qingshengii]MCZ8545460.1 hypothetical protein [Mesorhizobium qingshengii]